VFSAEYPCKRQSTGDYVAIVDVIIDGALVEEVQFPADFMARKLDLYWNFDLTEGKHKIELRLKNPDKKDVIDLKYVIVYSPVKL